MLNDDTPLTDFTNSLESECDILNVLCAELLAMATDCRNEAEQGQVVEASDKLCVALHEAWSRIDEIQLRIAKLTTKVVQLPPESQRNIKNPSRN
jgi:hypothetical protein